MSAGKGRVLTHIAAAALLGLAACKVIPLEADRAARAMQSGAFDGETYVEANWRTRALPDWAARQRPLTEVLEGVRNDPDGEGSSYGRRTGQGSPWVFPVVFEGRVIEVDRSRRAGRARVAVDGVAEPVLVQIGPVVTGFALRDSLPFVDFDDFPNQIAYADVGLAMTQTAFASSATALAALKAGDRISVAGVFPYADVDAPVMVTPSRLEIVAAEGAL